MAYKVLIVDDQVMPRQLFESFVGSSSRYELVASVETAKVAYAYCAGMEVDLVLMDVVMNDGSNGLEAAARIKAACPRTKIIIVTSMPDSVFLKRAREIGVDSFWYKEVQEKPLLEIMDRTMAGERVFPDKPPVTALGFAKSIEFTERELDVLRLLDVFKTDCLKSCLLLIILTLALIVDTGVVQHVAVMDIEAVNVCKRIAVVRAPACAKDKVDGVGDAVRLIVEC